MTFKTTLRLSAFAGAMAIASGASAGAIDSACQTSGRANDPGICSCIQQVADMTLSNRDQRRAASLFRDPEKAQDVRMSDRKSDADFWDRYKNFASTAEGFCNQ